MMERIGSTWGGERPQPGEPAVDDGIAFGQGAQVRESELWAARRRHRCRQFEKRLAGL
ncbi:MAG: hypothetical protein ACRERC_25740 [Candidatus Binatia bacterium]